MSSARRRIARDGAPFIGRFLVIDDDASYAEHIGALLRERRPVDVARCVDDTFASTREER